jgi:hypothetical protein
MTRTIAKFTSEDLKRVRARSLWDVSADDEAYQQRKAEMENGDFEQTEPDYA